MVWRSEQGLAPYSFHACWAISIEVVVATCIIRIFSERGEMVKQKWSQNGFNGPEFLFMASLTSTVNIIAITQWTKFFLSASPPKAMGSHQRCINKKKIMSDCILSKGKCNAIRTGSVAKITVSLFKGCCLRVLGGGLYFAGMWAVFVC